MPNHSYGKYSIITTFLIKAFSWSNNESNTFWSGLPGPYKMYLTLSIKDNFKWNSPWATLSIGVILVERRALNWNPYPEQSSSLWKVPPFNTRNWILQVCQKGIYYQFPLIPTVNFIVVIFFSHLNLYIFGESHQYFEH